MDPSSSGASPRGFSTSSTTSSASPEDIAAKHTLTRKDHELLSSWLRAAEAMMRRLLMIEAAHVAPETERKQCRRSVRKTRTVKEATPQIAGDASTWRVSFRCAPYGKSSSRRRGRGPKRELRFRSAWPLAKRYKAMIRLFNDPYAYAKRLARRLRAAPELAAVVLRAPPE